jgi:CubicO group peptidase (beta-lactamase class C family)
METSWAGESDAVEQIVETFARAAIQQGVTPGVGVGVVDNTGRRRSWAFGYANVADKTPFATDTIFEIASNTKVFTTNLLGQAAFEKRLSLNDHLSQFPRQLGTFMVPLTAEATLEQLGDFTAGFPDYAPLCTEENVPGCLPSARPPISQYSAQDFLDFFRATAPMNYQQNPPVPVTSQPAPYLYSDFSIGLLGLLIGTPPGRPVSDASVNSWLHEVEGRILRPLGMTSTYLDVPTRVPESRIAAGYSPALAEAQVSASGNITGITVLDGGGAYSSPPAVTITGGAGSGASASAKIKDGSVTEIDVAAGGSGYIAPPTIVTTGGGSTEIAGLRPIVAGGELKAVEVVGGGSGYWTTPTVVITGGRVSSRRDATAVAHIANGRVTSVSVTDPGAGYVPLLSVTVVPGNPESNVVPIWAPAGALLSTIDDMTRFAAAALGDDPNAAWRKLPPPLAAGFKTAETAYACTGPDPDLSTCPAGTNLSGLAWEILPADAANEAPQVVTKNGGLPGFSSQIFLVPERRLAVVVFVNSESHAVESETLGQVHPLAGAPAQVLAFNIGYAVLNSLRE